MVNKVELVGYIQEEPTFAYKANGNNMYKAFIEIPRTTHEHTDKLPLIITELQYMLILANINTWAIVSVEGAIVSRNYTGPDRKRHLELSVRVTSMQYDFTGALTPTNNIMLEAILCKKPIYRKTPMGKEICDLLLAHNREIVSRSDYIPAICWGKIARTCNTKNVGDRVTVSGRIQSRNYTKVLPDGTVETKTAYEVSANTVLMWDQNNRSDSDEQYDFEDFTDLD